MPLHRIILGLLPHVLALLLLAGVPVVGQGQVQGGDRARLIEASIKTLAPTILTTREWRCDTRAEPRGGKGGDPEPLLKTVGPEIALDRARRIEIGFDAYPTAPPSHRPCAAPPTGPPFLV